MSEPMTAEYSCGTSGGYHRHRKRGEAPCDACQAARSSYLKDYKAKKRAGTFTRASIEDRFWASVDISDDCWEWQGGRNANGYGQFHHDGKNCGAHRFAYVLLVGAVPEGLVLDHLCRNRACVNPAHLEPVTHRENVLRGEGITAESARRSHCVNGHSFDAANTRIGKDNKRSCRACGRDKQRRYMERRKEAANG